MAEVLIRVNEGMVDFDKKVVVTHQGKSLFDGKLVRSKAVIEKTFNERHAGDTCKLKNGFVLLLHAKNVAFSRAFHDNGDPSPAAAIISVVRSFGFRQQVSLEARQLQRSYYEQEIYQV